MFRDCTDGNTTREFTSLKIGIPFIHGKVKMVPQKVNQINKTGLWLRSTRNKGRQYRPPRLATDKTTGETIYHPLDMMRGGPKYQLKTDKKTGEDTLIIHSLKERPRNTTGSFGDLSTFQGIRVDKSKKELIYDHPHEVNLKRAASIVVTADAPGKPSSRSSKKRGGKGGLAVPIHLDYIRKLQVQLLNLRADIITLDILGKRVSRDFLNQYIRDCLSKIERHLLSICSADFIDRMKKADSNREDSLIGMLKAGSIYNVTTIRALCQRINKAMLCIKAYNKNEIIPSGLV